MTIHFFFDILNIQEIFQMTKIELLQETAQSLLNDESRIISTNEYLALISEAKTQEEKDFYSQMYDYLMKKKQEEVIANEKY